MAYDQSSIQCKLCGQFYGHDGNLVWADLFRMVFDRQGRYVVGFSECPLSGQDGFGESRVVCIYCLGGLGFRRIRMNVREQMAQASLAGTLRRKEGQMVQLIPDGEGGYTAVPDAIGNPPIEKS